jgi:hypothetical protein
MPRLKRNNMNDRLRKGFANGIIAQATAHGVSSAQLKRHGSKSYETTNKRLETANGDITVNDLICFAMAAGISFEELVISAAKAATEAAR